MMYSSLTRTVWKAIVLLLISTTAILNAPGQTLEQESGFIIPEGSLSIKEAFRIALENNPRIDEVESRIHKAEALISKAKTFLFPTVQLNSAYQAIHSTDVLDWMPTMRVEENLDKFNVGISMGWRIFDGLQSLQYLKAAERQLVATRYLHQDAQRVLLEQVAGAFVQSQLAVESMRISLSNCEFNERLLENAKSRYRLGEAPEADVLNFSLARAQARSSFKRAERDYKVGCSIIAQLLAFENCQLPKGKLPKLELSDSFGTVPGYEQSIASAMQYRPDYKATVEAVQAYEFQRKAVASGKLPTLDLVAGIRYNKTYDAGYSSPDENDRNIGIVLNWNLFDGGRRKAEEVEAVMQRREAEAQLRLLTNHIRSRIQQILIDLDTTEYLLGQQIQAENDVVKIRDYVEKAYNAGAASITRLNEVQNNWVQISGVLASIRLEHLLNEFRLKSATGEILEEIIQWRSTGG